MRLYTNNLTKQGVLNCITKAGLTAEGVTVDWDSFETFEAKHPYKQSIEVRLRGEPGKDRHGQRRRRPNPGTGWSSGTRAHDELMGATWDEWGYFIAEIFNADPEAKFPDYKSPQDFLTKTDYKYGIGVND